MIVRYWKNFPEQRNSAFYALISILEDRDPQVFFYILIFLHLTSYFFFEIMFCKNYKILGLKNLI